MHVRHPVFKEDLGNGKGAAIIVILRGRASSSIIVRVLRQVPFHGDGMSIMGFCIPCLYFCFLERRPRFLSTLQAQVNLGRGWRDARGNAASEKLSDAFKVPDVGVSLPLLSRRRFSPFFLFLFPRILF